MNTKTRILLIEDDQIDVLAFERALKRSEQLFEIKSCPTFSEALPLLTSQHFDFIFLDYQLPGTDGLEVLRSIRNHEIDTPVAIVTSHGDERLAAEMFKNGASDYFPKSEISPENLNRIINNGIRLWQSQQEKTQAEKQTKTNAAKLKAVLESTESSIYAVDQHLCYLSFNNAYRKLIQTHRLIQLEEGTSVFSHLQPSEQDRIANNLNKALEGNPLKVIEEFGCSSGETLYFDTTYNPIRDELGYVSGVAVFATDITEKQKHDKELLKAKNDAIAAAKAKTDFLSNMSHEIRTPMNAIIGITELLMDKNLDTESVEYLKSIKYSADNLLVIINDILDFSKIEAGKIALESIGFDLNEHFSELKKTFQHKAREKNLLLETSISPDVPPFLIGDPYRLNQILFNLVGNSVKFTLSGGIKVSAQLADTSNENEIKIQFKVSDTGIGIAKNMQARIFESFTQAYADTTRKFGGTGLGLAITRNLTILMGGNLWLESDEKTGTTFTIELPFRQGTQEAVSKRTKVDAGKHNLNGLRILVAEDNTINQFLIRQILTKWNAKIEIANNGKEAVEWLETTYFDIVLMDLQMPVMSGYEATAYILSKNTTVRNPSIPILALTADAFVETKLRVFEAGMVDFIAKPFNKDELFSKILKHCVS